MKVIGAKTDFIKNFFWDDDVREKGNQTAVDKRCVADIAELFFVVNKSKGNVWKIHTKNSLECGVPNFICDENDRLNQIN